MMDKKKAERYLLLNGFKPQNNMFNKLWTYEKEINGEKIIIDLNTIEKDFKKEATDYKKSKENEKLKLMRSFFKNMHIEIINSKIGKEIY